MDDKIRNERHGGHNKGQLRKRSPTSRKRPAEDPPDLDHTESTDPSSEQPTHAAKAQKLSGQEPSGHSRDTARNHAARENTAPTDKMLPARAQYTSSEADAKGAVKQANGKLSFSIADDPEYKGKSIYRTDWRQDNFRAGDIIHARAVERCLDPAPNINTSDFLAKTTSHWEGAYIGKIRPLVVLTLLPSGLLCLPVASHGGNGCSDARIMCNGTRPRYDAWRLVKSEGHSAVTREPSNPSLGLPNERQLEVHPESPFSPKAGASVQFRPIFLDYQSPISRNDTSYIRSASFQALRDWTMELVRDGFADDRQTDRLASFEIEESVLWREHWRESVRKRRKGPSREVYSRAFVDRITPYNASTIPGVVRQPEADSKNQTAEEEGPRYLDYE